MSDFYIREGDTASPVVDVLRDEAGAAVSIQGALELRFLMVPIRGGVAKVDEDASNDQVGDGSDGTKGNVSYPWDSPTQTDTPGDFLGSWRVTFAGGEVQTFPNAGYLLITVTPKAGDALAYVSLESFKKTLRLSNLTYADGDAEVAILAASRGLEAEYGGPWELGGLAEERYFTPQEGLVYVNLPDVADVDEVAVDQAGNGAFDLVLTPDVDYRLEPVGAGPWNRLRWLRSGVAWYWQTDPRGCGYYPFGTDSLRVTGQWGTAETPPGVHAATTIIAKRIMRRMRDAEFGGAIGLGLEGAVVRAGQLARDPEVAFAMKHPRARRRIVV